MVCGLDEFMCPNHDGSQFCIPMTTNNGCPGMCPMNCPGDSYQCPGMLDYNGCEMTPMCSHSYSSINDPNIQCPQVCMTYCGPDEMSCYGGTDPDGCELPGTCISMTLNDGCPNYCPMTCSGDSYECPGMTDHITGCPMTGTCSYSPPSNDPNIQCPQMCPTMCGVDMMTCSGGTDQNGCPRPEICVSTNEQCPESNLHN